MPRIIVSSTKTQISIHPAALDAHLWASEIQRLFDRNALPQPLLSALAKQPLQCIITDAPCLLLYAPLSTSVLWQEQQPPEHTLIICHTPEEISDEDICKAAWASVLSEVFNSMHSQMLPDLRDSLSEHMPQSLHYDFFMSKTFSDPMLCALTGIARSTLTDQRRAKKPIKAAAAKPPQEPSPEEVLQQLLQSSHSKD